MTAAPSHSGTTSSLLGRLGLAALLAGTVWPLLALYSGDTTMFTRENGVLESLHNALLGGSTLVFALSFLKARPGALKFSSLVMGAFCLVGFIREIEIDAQWLPWAMPHFDGIRQKAWAITPIALALAAYAWSQRAYILEAIGLAFKWRSWPIYAAALFLATGIMLDERGEYFEHWLNTRFWEELAETYGYAFMLIAALRHRQLVCDEL